MNSHRYAPCKNQLEQTRGFTIVETLIVLAVTGFLFAGAAVLITNRQTSTQFSQSVNNIQVQLQQIINEVGSGYYPNDGTFSCTKSPFGPKLRNSFGTVEQGTNLDCLFMGKALQFFGPTDTPLSTTFNSYTIAGLRGTTSQPTLSLAEAKPRLVARDGNDGNDVPDQYEQKTLLYGLRVRDMYYAANPSKKIGAVGFTSNLGNLGSADSSQQVNVLAITGTNIADAKPQGVGKINASMKNLTVAAGTVNPAGGVQICFTNDVQSAIVSIGGGGRQLSVKYSIKNNATCT